MKTRLAIAPHRIGRRAVALGLAACVLLAAAWLAYPPGGPLIALAGGVVGWLLARATVPQAPRPAAPEPKLPAPSTDGAAVSITALRHDLRGILSPAMLIADRLQAHQDPAVQRAGGVVMKTVERAAARLAETKETQVTPPAP